jgi:DNA-binding GntR family transcriptional regulator
MNIALGEIARRFDLQPVSRELQPLVRRAAVTLEPRRGARVRVSSRTPAA